MLYKSDENWRKLKLAKKILKFWFVGYFPTAFYKCVYISFYEGGFLYLKNFLFKIWFLSPEGGVKWTNVKKRFKWTQIMFQINILHIHPWLWILVHFGISKWLVTPCLFIGDPQSQNFKNDWWPPPLDWWPPLAIIGDPTNDPIGDPH